MMNLFSLGFVLTSLLVAQVWSPPSSYKQHQQQDLNEINDNDHVIVTHRVVVVETYDQKAVPVSIDKDIDTTREPGGSGGGELKCDSFVKCKDRFARAKDKAKERVFKAKENLKEDAHEARAHKGKEKIEDVYETTKDSASERPQETRDVIENAYEKAKQTVSDKAHKSKQKIDDVYQTAKDSASQRTQEAKDVIEKAKGGLTHKEQRTKESLQKAKETGKNYKRKASEILKYVGTIKELRSLMGVLHLLGFAIAYGMCVWVTSVSSYVLAAILQRHQFGLVRSKIFPVYFRAMATSILMDLLGYLGAKQDNLLGRKAEMLQGFNLMASFFLGFDQFTVLGAFSY